MPWLPPGTFIPGGLSMINPQPAPATGRRLRHYVANAVFAGLVLVIVGYAVIGEELQHGLEMFFITFMLWPLMLALGVAYAVISPGSRFVRALVVLVGLVGPVVPSLVHDAVDEVVNPINAAIEQRRCARKAEREERHLAFLQKYMSEPRAVVFVSLPYVVVEGGYSLALHDVQVPDGSRERLAPYFKGLLAGRRVTATFPPNFLAHYNSGIRSRATVEYARGPSQDYGDAMAIISVGGMNVNREITRKCADPSEPGSESSQPLPSEPYTRRDGPGYPIGGSRY
jgi:hypothetical protein